MRIMKGLPALVPLLLLSLLPLAASCTGGSGMNEKRSPGQTDFTTLEQGAPSKGLPPSAGAATGAAGGVGSATNAAPAAAPAGRVGEVQEADIYKLSGTRLFYLNTYRGFIVYDVADPKKPVRVSHLPVYGYPVEMFVDGNTVYALLREALYLTQTDGKLQFQRHNVSQLVTIDVTDAQNPRVLKTLDIIGELHEGVSRKIDKTIYVVSEQWGGYYWGWQTPDQMPQEQAWVYSYDVSDSQNPRQAGQLQIFQGGNNIQTQTVGPKGETITTSRYFSGVAISATANALMVVENWYSYSNPSTGRCGGSDNSEQAVVSLIDISDPKGSIRRHTHFDTTGSLTDQFKMTYRSDAATGTGTFFGIFASQTWGDCGLGLQTQNTLESWDVTDGNNPARLAKLDFGKPGESVRASAYDLARNVVYAITARQIDPLYAISIADPAAPRVLSAIDGLSGSVSVFRTVGGGNFLLGVGQDASDACSGTQDSDPNWHSTKMAVSIIDVRALDKIRLVQRKCVAIQNAEFSWSSVNWNLDQAHKMLGMFQDGDLNIITVPVSYYSKDDLNVGWWYRWQTAVGMLTWDLSRYDETKSATEQTVVQTFGTFVHPQGEVSRSILFKHPITGNRTMINISDTHLSLANIEDLAHPSLDAIIEVAPPVDEVYAFGDYLVERVDQGGYWSPTGMSEFRVKRAGGPVDDVTPVATFQVGQTSAVYRYKQNLVVLRNVFDPAATVTSPNATEAAVYDLSDPVHPRLASQTAVPFDTYRYYGFGCGNGWGGYWFGEGARTIVTDTGLVQLRFDYHFDGVNGSLTPTMAFLDLRDTGTPATSETDLPALDYWQADMSLVTDPAAPAGFYLARRDVVEQVVQNTGDVFTRYRHFAQRWETSGKGKLTAGASVNLPGPLARTWVDARGGRMFLTHDAEYLSMQMNGGWIWQANTRLNLLAQSGPVAALLDSRTFTDQSVGSFVVDSDRLYVSAQNQYYWYGDPTAAGATPPTWESTSDRLMIFGLSARTLHSLYDQPTRTYGVQLMGMHQGHLYVNLPGDGVLVTDVTNPAHPQGLKFMRTLGYASQIEFAGNDGYVPSGYFGVFHLDLNAPSVIPLD
jgi:hypothetical protein